MSLYLTFYVIPITLVYFRKLELHFVLYSIIPVGFMCGVCLWDSNSDYKNISVSPTITNILFHKLQTIILKKHYNVSFIKLFVGTVKFTVQMF